MLELGKLANWETAVTYVAILGLLEVAKRLGLFVTKGTENTKPVKTKMYKFFYTLAPMMLGVGAGMAGFINGVSRWQDQVEFGLIIGMAAGTSFSAGKSIWQLLPWTKS